MVFRTRYFIYPRFQVALVLANLAVVLLLFFVTIAFLGASFKEMADLGRSSGLPDEHVYFQFLRMQSHSLVLNLLAALVVALVVSTAFFVWLSHRLVGPIVSLISYLRSYQDKVNGGVSPPPLRFRKGDFFQDLAEQVNLALKTASAGESVKSEP